MATVSIHHMNDTKAEILALLKRTGGHSVNELAGTLSLAPITIRQHLTRLERDGLVLSEPVANGNGRPHYVFRLSAKAHAEAFPYRSDRLVELLIREIGYLDGSELQGLSERQRMFLLLERLAQRLANEYAAVIRGWPLQERVVFVTEVMQSDGGFAEWEETERGFEIRDFNCLFHRLLDGNVCEWHRTFLTSALGEDLHVEPCATDEHCCRYTIVANVPANAGLVS
jgi:DeoR family suf operon transcriptional repressor